MISAIFAAVVLLADSTTALQTTAAPATPAASPPAAMAPAAKKPVSDPNAVICKSEPVLGSRLPTKRCRTAGEIAQQRIEDRQAIERAQIRTDNGH